MDEYLENQKRFLLELASKLDLLCESNLENMEKDIEQGGFKTAAWRIIGYNSTGFLKKKPFEGQPLRENAIDVEKRHKAVVLACGHWFYENQSSKKAHSFFKQLLSLTTSFLGGGKKRSEVGELQREILERPYLLQVYNYYIDFLKSIDDKEILKVIESQKAFIEEGGIPEPKSYPKSKVKIAAESDFWELIEQSRHVAEEADELLIEDLKARLRALSKKEIINWQKQLNVQLSKLYSEDMCIIGYLMNSGYSDDGFDYFRAWVVSEGELVFQAFIKDPEAAALRYEKGGSYDCEELLYLTEEILTSLDAELPKSAQPKDLANVPWSINGQVAVKRFPKLVKHFLGYRKM